MPTLGWMEAVFCGSAIVVAFAVRGAAGFGAAAVAAPLASLMVPAQLVIPVIAALQLVSTAEYGFRNWQDVAWRELRRLAPVMMLGVATGLLLFAVVDPAALSKGLGICVVAYAVYVLTTSSRTESNAKSRLWWPIAAFLNWAGGVIGALFGGASTPFYAIYLDRLHLPRETFRATMTMIVLVQVIVRVVGYAGIGAFSRLSLLVIAGALPLMALGAFLGEKVVKRIPHQSFTRIVGVALLLSGTVLALK